MAQYKTGSVSVTNGSQTVTGLGTLWSSEVSSGDIFTVVGENAWYEIGSVDSDTQITLSASYAGVSASGAAYAITRDFTTNYGWPYPQKGDIETASLIKRAFEDIDAKLVLTNTDGDVTVAGDITLSGGTANGVAYLNGSKVLTSGSALTFDGTNLVVSSRFLTGVAGTVGVNTTDGADNGVITLSGGGSNSIGRGGVVSVFGNEHSSAPGVVSIGTGQVAGAYTVFSNNGNERMRLTSTGLGIGTSSPTNALSVSGNANITGNTTLGDASTDTVTVNGYMGVGATPAANIGIRVARTLTGNSQEWGVYADPTFDSSATVLGGGVGSKPATAATSFTVPNIFGFRSLDVTKGAGSTITNQHGLYIDDQTQGTNNYGITSLVSSGTNKWNIYASGTAANYFAGNVGIGTSSPSALLTVNNASGNLTANFVGTTGAYAGFWNGATNVGYVGSAASIVTSGASADLALRSTAGNIVFAAGGSTERARITSSGNLLVGTTTPSAPTDGMVYLSSAYTGSPRLELAHASGVASGGQYVAFRYAGTVIGSITQSGTTGVLYNITSDQRLKENIQDADSASELIDLLQVRKYDWKADGTHQRYGFIAQELVTVVPEAVHQPANPEEMMAVDYSKLVPLLVKEIQSIRARLTAAGL